MVSLNENSNNVLTQLINPSYHSFHTTKKVNVQYDQKYFFPFSNVTKCQRSADLCGGPL